MLTEIRLAEMMLKMHLNNWLLLTAQPQAAVNSNIIESPALPGHDRRVANAKVLY